MKYLKNRQEFLYKEVKIETVNIQEQIKSSEMINEAFENDITWGGSLLGRLINSTIRKGKIYFQTMRIGSVVNQVRNELDNLVGIAATNEEQRKQVYNLQVKFLLTEIYKVVISKESLETKLTALLGDKSEDSGLIMLTIKEIEKLTDEQLENKNELIEKLKRFRQALLGIDFEPVEENDENENENFFNQTISLLKSIVQINEVISGKQITSTKVEVNKEYTDRNNKVCLVISLENQFIRDPQNYDDVKENPYSTEKDKLGPKLKPNQALVVYRDEATKKYLQKCVNKIVNRIELKPYNTQDTVDLNKIKISIPTTTIPGQKTPDEGELTTSGTKPATTKQTVESLFYENESLPIFEATELKENETHAKAAWSKITNYWNKSGITKMIPRIQELVKKAESGSNPEKSWIMNLGRQIVMNKSTVGANPIKFEDLIKEAESIPSSYNDIPKAISLVSRYLLAFNEDIGLLGSLGDVKKPVETFLSAFRKMSEIYPNLKKEAKTEEKTSENSYKLYDYSKFRLFEAEGDIEMEEETEEITDKVKTEWSKEFKEGEEKEWKVNEPEAKKLQKEIDENAEKGIQIDADSYKDNIIRIVNLFGKAYKMYAVSSIPSGRPGGRVSQKTFREYTYIGGDETPGYRPELGSEKGPWAANLPFEKWQNGIMKILEDTKYRKVLANTKFKNRGPNQKEGSGLTLFNFINDMLGESGKGSNFRTRRHEILKKYFDGTDIEKKSEPTSEGTGKIKKEDYGKSGELDFIGFTSIGRTLPFNFKKNYGPKGDYSREFFKLEYFDGSTTMYLTGFVMGILKGTRSSGLVLKFHKSSKKESIITTYLKDKEYKLPPGYTYEKNQPLFVGVININENEKLSYKSDIVIKTAEITGMNTFGEVEDLQISFRKIYSLCNFNPEKGKWNPIKLEGAPTERPAKDITGINDKLGPKKSDFGIE